MIWFNFIFGIALFASLRTLFADYMYANTIKQAAAVSLMPEMMETMKGNSHFRKCVRKAHHEYMKTIQIWIPLTVIAIVSLVAGWMEGYQSGKWLLEESTVVWMTIAALPVYARPWTHPTDASWLTQWAGGMKAVLIANEFEQTKARMEELKAIPYEEITPVQFVEFQALAAKMKQLEQLIGTLPEPQQSEQKE